jgi:hypothetical protein
MKIYTENKITMNDLENEFPFIDNQPAVISLPGKIIEAMIWDTRQKLPSGKISLNIIIYIIYQVFFFFKLIIYMH